MGEAVQLIEKNVKKISDVKEQCKIHDADIRTFQADLRFNAFELEVVELDYPMTVCAHEDCKKYVPIGKSREMNTVYEQICHHHCYLSGVPVEVTNNEQLYGCAAMSGGNCNLCNHSYRVHMHVTYTTTTVEKEFLSDDAQQKIMQKSNLKARKETFIAELEASIKELEAEKKFIYECASFFGVFLKENAMIAYNDSFGEYLDMLIKEEEAKERHIRDDKKIAQLKNDKITYEQKKKIIVENINSTPGSKSQGLPTEKIYEMRNKLCSLKHNGKTLKKALGMVRCKYCWKAFYFIANRLISLSFSDFPQRVLDRQPSPHATSARSILDSTVTSPRDARSFPDFARTTGQERTPRD